MLFGILSGYLLVRHHFYLSTLSFAIAFIVIGQQLKWKKEHFDKIKSSRIWIIHVITWILAVYGLWLDFYAGSMFLFFGFILIGIESSRKEINWVNIILAIINISLSLIAFIMHLQYTVKLNF
jgi:protein-S-isoprenylcysteine O-methyltransferase Ste14